MKKGCLILGIIGILVFVCAAGYCGITLYNTATEEVPKVKTITQKFIEYYNADSYSDIYAMVDSVYSGSISKDKNEEQVKKIKGMTGKMILGAQVGWNAQNFNAQKYLTVLYNCDTDKGKIQLTMKYHMEVDWKLQGYNIGMK